MSETTTADPPPTMADVLQLLIYRRAYPEFKRTENSLFPAVMTPTQAYNRMNYCAANCPDRGRLDENGVAKLSAYRRLLKVARWDYNADLDETIFRSVVGDIADTAGVPYDDVLRMTAVEFDKLMDRWYDFDEPLPDDEADPNTTPPRGRGRPPAIKTDAKAVRQAIRLYRDWKTTGLTIREFLLRRGIPEEEGRKTIDRGEYHANKSGNNSPD